MTGVKETMEEVQQKELGESRQQLEMNIKIAHNWRTAVSAGMFSGRDWMHIATLLDFLQKQHDESVKQYETKFPATPEYKAKA
jgi:hypothetical protein